MRPTDDELGTLLATERPAPTPAFAAALDAWIADGCVGTRPGARPAAPPRRRLRWAWGGPALATALAGLVAVVVALSAGGGTTPAPTVRKAPATAGGAASSTAGGAASSTAARVPQPVEAQALSSRKLVQASAIQLGAPADRIDDVAQEVLRVVASYDGVVDRSIVTSGDGGSAHFELRLPSARLQPALGALSRLAHAHVISRTDDVQDVNQPYVTLRRRIADASAERAGVLRALAIATSAAQTTRLRERLAALDRTLASLEARQRGLDRAIAFSRVTLDVEAQATPVHHGAFTPGRGLHDAGRLLAVTAGVMVIAAAALVPLAIVLAGAWPLARALRRRRREQALDVAG
jgi:uncharacterized protein DUF4349